MRRAAFRLTDRQPGKASGFGTGQDKFVYRLPGLSGQLLEIIDKMLNPESSDGNAYS